MARGKKKGRKGKREAKEGLFKDLDDFHDQVLRSHNKGRKYKTKGKDMHSHNNGDWRGGGYGGQQGSGQASTPQAPVDPAIVKAITDYRIYEGPESFEGLTKPKTWFMAGNGLVPVLVSPVGHFIGKAQGAPVPGLPPLTGGVQLRFRKLPWAALSQVVAFFRDIHKEIKSEAMVQFFWDPDARDGDGDYIAHVPLQVVSGGGVHHQGHFDKGGQVLHVLDIHSHHTMGAFWSGTDDADESRFEGRLFGVIGKIDRAIPHFAWRMRCGGAFFDLKLEDVVDMTGQTHTVRVEKTFDVAQLIEVAQGGRETKNTEFFFTCDPFADATYPPEWRKAVLDTSQVRDYVRPPVVKFNHAHMTDKQIQEMKALGYDQDPNDPSLWTLPNARRQSPSHHTPDISRRTGVDSATGGTATGGGSTNGSNYRGYVPARTTWVYSSKGQQLYIVGPDGWYYPSYRKVGNGAEDIPGSMVTFVSEVDISKIRTCLYPGSSPIL